jgi:hypothetical protein
LGFLQTDRKNERETDQTNKQMAHKERRRAFGKFAQHREK